MEAKDIKLSDLHRVFIGDVPPSFFIELILRAVFVYLLLMVSMRVMGKRMSSQLSRNEMAAVVSLAAAIGIPLMNADRGILPAVVVAIIIVSLQIILAKLAAGNEAFESLTQDKLTTLINDGKLDLLQMKKTRISRERLFAQLRSAGITHLGEVKRFYFEADGSFSIIKDAEKREGLSIIPKFDYAFIASKSYPTPHVVCSVCATRMLNKTIASAGSCSNCGSVIWENAVMLKENNHN